jgi:Raf kinase inhibitor-like YbhB/YbcL family protein
MLRSQRKDKTVKLKGRCRREHLQSLFLAGGIFLASWCMGRVVGAAEPFTLTSSAFKDGTPLQKKNSNNTQGNANCIGENVSPPLTWSNPPAGTKSFALTMVDPEGRGGTGVIHWVAYGIPASVTGFAEGEVSKPSDKYVGGKGTAGQSNYMGPCTPPGMPHHYTLILIATDLEPTELPPGLTRDELFAKLTGHTKGATGLIGLFGSP